jgi:hypothetical protein
VIPQLSFAGVNRSLFLVGHLYLLGVWLGMDQRTNTIHEHVLNRLDYVFSISLAIPHPVVSIIGGSICLIKESTNIHF